METWVIMLGCQAFTAILSLGVVLNFMYEHFSKLFYIFPF